MKKHSEEFKHEAVRIALTSGLAPSRHALNSIREKLVVSCLDTEQHHSNSLSNKFQDPARTLRTTEGHSCQITTSTKNLQ